MNQHIYPDSDEEELVRKATLQACEYGNAIKRFVRERFSPRPAAPQADRPETPASPTAQQDPSSGPAVDPSPASPAVSPGAEQRLSPDPAARASTPVSPTTRPRRSPRSSTRPSTPKSPLAQRRWSPSPAARSSPAVSPGNPQRLSLGPAACPSCGFSSASEQRLSPTPAARPSISISPSANLTIRFSEPRFSRSRPENQEFGVTEAAPPRESSPLHLRSSNLEVAGREPNTPRELSPWRDGDLHHVSPYDSCGQSPCKGVH